MQLEISCRHSKAGMPSDCQQDSFIAASIVRATTRYASSLIPDISLRTLLRCGVTWLELPFTQVYHCARALSRAFRSVELVVGEYNHSLKVNGNMARSTSRRDADLLLLSAALAFDARKTRKSGRGHKDKTNGGNDAHPVERP